MNIQIKGIDIEITEAIHDYADKKITEALEKFLNDKNQNNVLVEVELSKTNKRSANGDMYIASAKINGLDNKNFFEVIKDDLYASIDGLKDKINENLAQRKDKKKTLSHKVAYKFKNIFKRGE